MYYSSGGYISAPLEDIVEPGSVLVQEGQLLMPMSISQDFDFTDDGEDGEGDDVTVKALILWWAISWNFKNVNNSEAGVTRRGNISGNRDGNNA